MRQAGLKKRKWKGWFIRILQKKKRNAMKNANRFLDN